MTYWFKCEKECGKYLVDAKTLEGFIVPELKDRLADRIARSDVVEAILIFKRDCGCPRCVPDGEYQMTFGVVTAREIGD